ncbi:hypothetical protein SKAU_G00317740 [Synaphobranchus kaupii]|uniref:Uncharacterized protein n=1 Tax=Synaphobranchus kaupii TaxID=118154 RepID=A0A9Q1ESX7_SYNKA|nr:hypothetical protein SKAU_G00317740 [Synaphobranchus kaupii]
MSEREREREQTHSNAGSRWDTSNREEFRTPFLQACFLEKANSPPLNAAQDLLIFVGAGHMLNFRNRFPNSLQRDGARDVRAAVSKNPSPPLPPSHPWLSPALYSRALLQLSLLLPQQNGSGRLWQAAEC